MEKTGAELRLKGEVGHPVRIEIAHLLSDRVALFSKTDGASVATMGS